MMRMLETPVLNTYCSCFIAQHRNSKIVQQLFLSCQLKKTAAVAKTLSVHIISSAIRTEYAGLTSPDEMPSQVGYIEPAAEPLNV